MPDSAVMITGQAYVVKFPSVQATGVSAHSKGCEVASIFPFEF